MRGRCPRTPLWGRCPHTLAKGTRPFGIPVFAQVNSSLNRKSGLPVGSPLRVYQTAVYRSGALLVRLFMGFRHLTVRLWILYPRATTKTVFCGYPFYFMPLSRFRERLPDKHRRQQRQPLAQPVTCQRRRACPRRVMPDGKPVFARIQLCAVLMKFVCHYNYPVREPFLL